MPARKYSLWVKSMCKSSPKSKKSFWVQEESLGEKYSRLVKKYARRVSGKRVSR